MATAAAMATVAATAASEVPVDPVGAVRLHGVEDIRVEDIRVAAFPAAVSILPT